MVKKNRLPRTFKKDIICSVKNSFARFMAILIIVALGAGFYAGLNAVAPDMRATVDKYCRDRRLFDIRVVSTLGLTQEDVDAIRNTEGIENVMAGYTVDAISEIGDTEKVIRVHSLPRNTSESYDGYLNRPLVTSGRMPSAVDECVVSESKMTESGIEIGDTVVLENDDGSLDDTMAQLEFKVVGVVRTPYYMSFNLGTTTKGSGSINRFIYVLDEAFCSEVYTDFYATVEGADELDCFTQEYDDLVQSVIDRLEPIADARETLRYDDVYGTAKEKLDDARAELEDAKTELSDQKEKAETELADAEQQLADAEKTIAEVEITVTQGQNKLIDSENELKSHEDEYNTAKAGLASGIEQLCAAAAYMGASDEDIAVIKAVGSPDSITNPYLAAAYGEQYQTLAQASAFVAQYEAGKAALAEGWKQWQAGNDAYVAARDALPEQREELEKARKEADEKIADAEAQIADAEEELRGYEIDLEDLDDCTWYLLTRNENEGFASFTGDADRMGSLGTVFPVLFFLVAALVALTTMTRMVDEERVLIGTYKSLGLGNRAIMTKYLLYALIATVVGAVIGVVIGFYTLPYICWNSYLLVYTAPKLTAKYYVKYALEGLLASAACTLGATYSSCRASLKEWPSTLMLPKSPPIGKRILLERIGFIWQRTSFIWKVTFRNLFRYKKRLIMTVVGIAGCTGLMLTGFGIKNSISEILDKQYEEIYIYDTTVTLSDGNLSDSANAALDSTFADRLAFMEKSAELTAGDEKLTVVLSVPEDADRLNDYIVTRERKSGKAVPFGSDSVLITEKAARELGVSVGDEVSAKIGDDAAVTFTITGITENYVYHYLYVSPEIYAKTTGNEFEADKLAARLNDGVVHSEASKKLLDYAGISTVAYNTESMETFANMIKSLDYITLVLIFCAGALAFVVLYNLTNINITERIRELATIKVLGFRAHEVAAYIFRETALLTLIGGVIGLGLGVIMHSFVITTVEVDMVMFGRTIKPMSFLYSFLLTLVFTAIVDLFMYRKLGNISMVESLKSVD